MVISFAVTGSSTAQAVVSCDLAEGFSRMSDGNLFRLQDPTLLSAANSMTQSGQVGKGWGTFAWTGAGGDGVIYALTMTGQLLWYRWDAAGAPGCRRAARSSRVHFGSRVNNIAVGADGWIYTRPDLINGLLVPASGRRGACLGNSGGSFGSADAETIAPGDGVIIGS
jgi:YD repeat-containing protein